MAVKRFYFFGSYSSAPTFRPFIMEVESDVNGEFTIPTTGGGYNYDVKTSDGQTFSGVTGNLTITFPSANTHYDVEITGDFPRIYFNNGSERLKIKDIKQWGDIVWGIDQDNSYFNANDVTCTAIDSPNMTLVTSGASMFRNAFVFNPPNFAPTLENLTNGFAMFWNAYAFNPPNFAPTLENLTNGGSMFQGASAFNPPNFAPTLKSLTNGGAMFRDASEFAQEIYCPNTTQLTNDSYMFTGTKIAKITLNNTALTTTNAQAYNCPLLTDLILIDRKINLDIRFSPLLTGVKIDNLANSVADMTGQTSPTITMTTAQYSSCDTSIWTNKNWTIAQV